MTYRKMKPCPRCGSAVTLFTYENASRVECSRCDYMAMPAGTIPHAIEAHNAAKAGGGNG
jgi:ribosomal protein S27AE